VVAAAGADPSASDAEPGNAVDAGRLNDSKWRHGAAGMGVAAGAGAGVAAEPESPAAGVIEAAGVSEAGHRNEPPVSGAATGAATGAEPESPAEGAAAGVASDSGAVAAAGADATVAAGSDLPHAWQLVWPRKNSLAPQNWHV